MNYYPQFPSSSPGPAPLRFAQIVQVGSGEDATLVGLTPQGQLYARYFDEDAGVLVWRPASAFSSTELVEDLTCSACGVTFGKGFPHERCLDCGKGTLLPKAGPIPPSRM